jgi:hypothetical protein
MWKHMANPTFWDGVVTPQALAGLWVLVRIQLIPEQPFATTVEWLQHCYRIYSVMVITWLPQLQQFFCVHVAVMLQLAVRFSHGSRAGVTRV